MGQKVVVVPASVYRQLLSYLESQNDPMASVLRDSLQYYLSVDIARWQEFAQTEEARTATTTVLGEK